MSSIDNIEDWLEAGRIAKEAMKAARKVCKEEEPLVNITDTAEKKIKDMGGEIAFPAQISINQVAAHYCPQDPNIMLNSEDIAKIDLGVHINGAVADTASSITLSSDKKRLKLIEASKDALNNALDMIEPGTKIGEIGKVIDSTIKHAGFSSIKNLSGHGLDRFVIHTSPTIPNYDNSDNYELKPGDTFAIEPFATTGHGMVIESNDTPNIFSIISEKKTRNPISQKILKDLKKEFSTLPFTSKWFSTIYGEQRFNYCMNDLMKSGIVRAYPPLIEIQKGLVSQAEHSVLIEEDKAIVFTR